jgi:hypothetical protein
MESGADQLSWGEDRAGPAFLPTAPSGLATDGSFTLLIPRGLRHSLSPLRLRGRRTAAAGRRRSGRRITLICPPPREGRRLGPRDHAPALGPSTIHPCRSKVGDSLLAPPPRTARPAEAGAYPRAAAECWVDEACQGTSIHRPRLRLRSRLSRGRWRARGHC